jgi:hypothetical protein
MEPAFVRFCACNASPPVIVENVPAQVCTRCGDRVFPDSAVEVFESIRDGQLQPYGLLWVNVFDFAQLRQPTAPVAVSNGITTDAAYRNGFGTEPSQFQRVEVHAGY